MKIKKNYNSNRISAKMQGLKGGKRAKYLKF